MQRAALILIGLLCSLQVWAYVPPSEFIIRNIIAKHVGAKTIKIQSKVFLMNATGQPTVQAKEILRLDLRRGTARSVVVDSQGQTVHFRDEVPIASLWKVLFSSQSEEVIKVLIDSGVPIRLEAELLKLPGEPERRAVEIESISRAKSKISWLIGSDKTAGRFWVEKDVFLPLKWGKNWDGKWLEFQFDQYLSQKGIPYPKAIEINLKEGANESSEMAIRVEITDVLVNADSKDGVATTVTEPSSDLRGLLENYYRLIQ